MSMKLEKSKPAARTPERPDAAGAIASSDVSHTILPHDPPPLTIEQAIDIAEARLDEAWFQPDARHHMVESGLAQEFAATLCAYGLIEEEREHTRDRKEPRPADAPPPPEP
jgi:hypothetical protein